jgi:chromosomal replication initiation ATPase DnaA
MKEDVFNQYVVRVLDLYSITKEELFTKSKKRYIVDARQLLYYLCFNRNMKLITIQKFMEDNGYKISHCSVTLGINSVADKVKEDRDYKSIINDIDKAVFI